jgi:hypothetical protein
VSGRQSRLFVSTLRKKADGASASSAFKPGVANATQCLRHPHANDCIILQLKSRHGALDKVIDREPERSVLLVREHRIADKLL